MGLPVKDVTIFYGVDALAFQTVGDVIEHVKQYGLVDLPDKKNTRQATHTELGVLGLRLSYEFLLRKIASLESDSWHVIWLDDIVLTRPYEAFKEVLCNAPNDAKMIAVYKRIRSSSGETLEKHPHSPFYHGTVGSGADHCLVLLPEGAKRILEIGENHKLVPYEHVLEQFYLKVYADTDRSGIYTSGEKWIEPSYIDRIVSDIWMNHHRMVGGLQTLGYEDTFLSEVEFVKYEGTC